MVWSRQTWRITDASVDRIVKYVKKNGLGFLGLHSTHFARPFKALMETECSFRAYVENGTKGDIKIVAPDHPIAEGLSDFTIPRVWNGMVSLMLSLKLKLLF